MPPNLPLPAAPAPLAWRLLAATYDLLPLLALWFSGAALGVGLTGGALDVHRLGDKLLVQSIAIAFTAVYFVVSWVRGGQTIGMKAWRLRVVRSDGRPLGMARALLRFAIATVSLAAVGIGFAWALVDERHRTWHDLAADTVMVRMQKG